ncbi:FAD-binding protein [Sphingomonas bacterium]|uniref:FAD-binding protein n=1 Tax=Sphingomonas bacterium TaxID=1895847 RepID=UPI0015762431|nr:FAD-binding protein [Sphingomonas bacterium]
MTGHWDEETDLIVIGSGGGAFAAALAAVNAGLSVIIFEKGSRFGGSTAMSGGILWLPGNPVLKRTGDSDSIAEGRTYLDALIGQTDPSSTPSRREAFLQAIAPMVAMLEGEGLKFYACEGYSDYYDDLPGGHSAGRAIGAKMISAKRLGDDRDRLQLLPGWNLPIATDEFAAMSLAARTIKGKIMTLRVAARSLRQKLEGAPLYFRGAALQARMLLAVRKRGIDLRAKSPVAGLIEEDGAITGVRITPKDGEERRVRARRGVLIAAGGYARNPDLRRRHQQLGSGSDWTMANPGDTGDLLTEAIAHGAATAHLDQSWWVPVSLKANGQIAGFHSPQEMQKPYCITVNAKGARFVNEGASYMELGQAMRAHDGVPAWVVMDARHRRYYPWGAVPPRVMPGSWLKSGYMKRAGTIEELAAQCGIDAEGLKRTVERFNRFAHAGRDEDFHRGDRAYDRYQADPRVKPNPSLGAIEQAPFYAVRIVPGDVGTAGGLMADEDGRVLRADGSPIAGLYVTGNASAPVFGSTYPGPGASIAASFVFGYRAARHAAGANHV